MCTVSDMRKNTANKHTVSSEKLKVIQIRTFLSMKQDGTSVPENRCTL